MPPGKRGGLNNPTGINQWGSPGHGWTTNLRETVSKWANNLVDDYVRPVREAAALLLKNKINLEGHPEEVEKRITEFAWKTKLGSFMHTKAAATLITGIRESPVTDKTLERTVITHGGRAAWETALWKAKPGSTITLDRPTSFSGATGLTSMFGTHEGLESHKAAHGNILIKIEGRSQSLPIHEISPEHLRYMQEHLIMGKFTVVRIEPPSDAKGALPGGKISDMVAGVHYDKTVVVQHTGMF
jgi:hypothetical protein